MNVEDRDKLIAERDALRRTFNENGGRGVDLAERIDALNKRIDATTDHAGRAERLAMTAADRLSINHRFDRVREHYEAEQDNSVPGADWNGRYAVVTKSGRGFGFSASRAATLPDAERVAAANIHEHWTPVALYDLESAAGELHPDVGDKVAYEGESWYVCHASDDLHEGVVFWKLWLGGEPDLGLDECDHVEIDEKDVSILDRAEPDTRLPLRYDVATVRTIVAFNTTPEGG
jgi:hypothetical protein